MKENFEIVLISSPENFAGEHEMIEQMFEIGLQKIYVRKPNLPDDLIERWTLGFDIKRQDRVFNWCGSAHSFEELQKFSTSQEICFLSPVFDSISKHGYKSKFSFEEMEKGVKEWKEKNLHRKLYALGGVECENISSLIKLGFDGAAVLGSIWHSADPVGAMEEMLQKLQHI